MLRNQLLIAYRTLLRHAGFSAINIAGLSLGLSAFFILIQYVNFELSYDRYHTNADNIYRIRHDIYKNGAFEVSNAITYYGAGPAIKETFPVVENFVRLHRADGMLNYYDATKREVISRHEQKSFYADSSFFSIFSFPLLSGERSKVLRRPNGMVMSASAAKKYFGTDDPIGKVITLTSAWQGGDYVVEGIFEDVPENSHLKFDFIFSIHNLLSNSQFKSGTWYWTNFYTYLLLKPDTDTIAFEEKLSIVVDTHLGSNLRKLQGAEKFILQPLTDIHLRSNIGGEVEVNSDYQSVVFLMIISFFIISIAWLNFINLSTAKASERSREVGIRKVLGSTRAQLIRQFLLEACIITLVSVLMSVVIVIVVNPFFEELVSKRVIFDPLRQPGFWGIIIATICAGAFLAGLYPAFFLSSFKPVAVLKGKFVQHIGSIKLREVLVVLQFTASIALIIGTITVYKQLQFMRAQDLGMNIQHKLVVKSPRIIPGESYLNAMRYFKNQLSSDASFARVTMSSEVPGKEIFWTNEFRLMSEGENIRRLMNILVTDDDFIPSYEIDLIAGRNFSPDIPSDFGEAVIINETASNLFGFSNPELAIHQPIVVGNSEFKKIIGVVRDFHQQSFKRAVAPTVIYNIPWASDYLTLTLATHDLNATLPALAEVFKKSFPDNAFEYFFLDDQFSQQYRAENQLWKIFILFSALSIFVACLGLFGLSSFTIAQRVKEIAIRKIVGASATRIVALLSIDFIRLIGISILLGSPVTVYFLYQWLDGFAYRITLSWWIPVVSGALTLGIALVAISFRAIRAAYENPVKAIKAE